MKYFTGVFLMVLFVLAGLAVYAQLPERRESYRKPESRRGNREFQDERTRMLERLKRHDPETFETMQHIRELEREAEKLAGEYARNESETRREDMEVAIQDIVREAFQVKFELSDRKLEEMEQRLADLRRVHEERKQRTAELVARYVETLLREHEERFVR